VSGEGFCHEKLFKIHFIGKYLKHQKTKYRISSSLGLEFHRR
jgi:hypothetical protein